MVYIKKATLLAIGILLLASWDVNAVAAVTTDFSKMDAAVGDYTKSATADLEKRKGAIGTLMTEKGHDDIVGPMLIKLHERVEKSQKDIAELETEAVENNARVKADLEAIDKVLAAAAAIPAQAATAFPMACGNPNALKGFELHAGVLEPSPTGKMVLSKADEKVDGGLRQILLSDDTGLAGKSVSDPVISRTSKDRYVEAHVDAKANNGKGLVMCISQEINVNKFKANEEKYTK